VILSTGSEDEERGTEVVVIVFFANDRVGEEVRREGDVVVRRVGEIEVGWRGGEIWRLFCCCG
jgi:hypothetical protein